MENENGVEEIADVILDTEEAEPTENEAQDEEDTPSGQKNKSNWKKMSESKKQLEKELKEARQELASVKEWANSLYDEDSEKPFAKKEAVSEEDKVTKLERRLFLSENQEAKEYLDEITQAQKRYSMDLEEAWTFVKAKLPPESTTKKDFNLGNKSAPVKKKLEDINAEEALKLPKEEQRKWRQLQGWE